jgi:hypothetical protein
MFPQRRHNLLIEPAWKSMSPEVFSRLTEKYPVGIVPTKTVPMIGLQAGELRWIRMLVYLLRHPDPSVAELARHAMLHLTAGAAETPRETLDHAG